MISIVNRLKCNSGGVVNITTRSLFSQQRPLHRGVTTTTITNNHVLKRLYSSQPPQQPQQQNDKNTTENNNNNNEQNNQNTDNNTNDNSKQDAPQFNLSQSRTITWASVLIAIISGSAGWLYYDHLMTQKREKVKEIKTYGSSAIGGPFSLIDQNGKAVSDLDFRGKYVLLYFGFTYCPDACPAELDKITQVLNNLEKYNLLDSVVPVFITIDPWRDTVEQVRDYIQEFHPKFVGLTGTPEQITKLAKYYRVFMSKAGKGDSYLVDHTIITYLLGPDGRFIEFYNSAQNSELITNKILEKMTNRNTNEVNKGEIVKEESVVEKILSIFK
ncbi:hypothetical protein CYY_008282 [Polysphondylium violaceum]|uniref:Thioredoxin domain-containing protein n=1 Tax=Polysphondylium violaceum TaxID=133409 RepID=A0A8J4UQ97_9MYCE|nr:hypothetical protein CYY_008282 [Polysphondylium violaceum]